MTTDGAVGGSSWSPDGSQIAFNEDTNGTNQINTVDVASGTVTGPLTSAGEIRTPHWSPDGSRSSSSAPAAPLRARGVPDLRRRRIRVPRERRRDEPAQFTQATIFDADPAWSPDGSQIAFVRDLGGQAFNVFTANADGTNQVELTFGGSVAKLVPQLGHAGQRPTRTVEPERERDALERRRGNRPGSDLHRSQCLARSSRIHELGSRRLDAGGIYARRLNSGGIYARRVHRWPTPVGSTGGSTPVGSTPVGSTGLFDLPVGSTPVGSTALSSVLLSQVQLHGVSWDQILCGSLLNKPLTALTLQDLKTSTEMCSDGKTSLQHFRALTLRQVDLTTTLLRSVHWATLLMGNTALSALPGGFAAWCGTNGNIPADGGDCTSAGPTTTVLQMDVAGHLGSAPVGSTPVG